jgi:hypothetical protein
MSGKSVHLVKNYFAESIIWYVIYIKKVRGSLSIQKVVNRFSPKLDKKSREMHTLSAHARDYLSALKTVFESVGLDYLYHVSDFNKERFNAFIGQFSSTKLRNEIMSKSSLRDYIAFYCNLAFI